MIIVKRTVLTLVLGLCLVPLIGRGVFAQALTADQIIEKHLAAVGGRERLSKLTTRRATGTMSIGTPMGDLSGPVEMMAKSPNKMRATISVDMSALGAAGTMVIDQYFDGTTGLMGNSMQGDTPMSGDELESAKNTFFPSPLLNYKEHGFTVALQPNEKVNDRDAYVLLVTPKTGPAERMFFDTQTFMLVRTVSRINHPQLGQVDQVSEASDYRDVDGVKAAFQVVQSAGGQIIAMKFTKIENNVDIPDSVFVKK